MIRKRTLVKGITWELSGILTLGLGTWFITDAPPKALLFSFLYTTFRVIMFYIHEKLWKKTSWGKDQ